MINVRLIRTWTCGFAAIVAATVSATPGKADLRFGNTSVKLGQVKSGTIVRHSFQFVNQAKTDVTIVELRPGCGCLLPNLPKKRFAPGERGSIPLEVNTIGESAGAHRWYVYVQYKYGDATKVVALQLWADVVPELFLQPSAVKIRGRQLVRQTLFLTDVRRSPAKITRVRTTNKNVRIDLGTPSLVDAGQTVTPITAIVAETMPDGRHQGFIFLDTSDPKYPTLKIPFDLKKTRRLSVTARPANVEIRGRPDDLPSRLIIVRSTDSSEIQIDRISCPNAAIACRWAKAKARLTTIRVRVDGSRLTSADTNTAITIHFRNNKLAPLVVPVRVSVQR